MCSKRAIQRELETPLSKRLLKADIKAGSTVVADYNAEDGLSFKVEETAPAETKAAVVQA